MTHKLKRPGQVGGKRDENRRTRSRELTQAALPLFLRQGIESTTIDDIVERATVAKGSFYRYFSDKQALVRALYAPLSAELQEVFSRGHAALNAARSPQALVEVYQQLAFSSAAVLFAHREEVLLYLQESRAPVTGARAPIAEVHALLRRWAIDLTLAAHKRKLLRKFDPAITSLAVLGATEALLLDYLRDGDSFADPVTVAQTLITMVLEGLRT